MYLPVSADCRATCRRDALPVGPDVIAVIATGVRFQMRHGEARHLRAGELRLEYRWMAARPLIDA